MLTITPNLTIPKRKELESMFDWVSSYFVDDNGWKYYDDQLRNSDEKECVLFEINETLTTEQIIERMKTQGLEPASFQELLAFAGKYPYEQRKYPIVALGSVCRHGGSLYSPYVRWDVDERDLGFFWIDDGWLGYYRFLAWRKPLDTRPLVSPALDPSATATAMAPAPANSKKDMKSEKLFAEFSEYCRQNPNQRFHQAYRNFLGVPYVFVGDIPEGSLGAIEALGLRDNFYWENKND